MSIRKSFLNFSTITSLAIGGAQLALANDEVITEPPLTSNRGNAEALVTPIALPFMAHAVAEVGENKRVFFWGDHTYSEYEFDSSQSPPSKSSPPLSTPANWEAWPMDLDLLGVANTTYDYSMFFWSNGTHSVYNTKTRKLIAPPRKNSIWKSPWPNKQLIGVAQIIANHGFQYFFWDDNTYSETVALDEGGFYLGRFTSDPRPIEQLLNVPTKGLQIKSLVTNPYAREMYVFWHDGTFSLFEIADGSVIPKLSTIPSRAGISYPASILKHWDGWPMHHGFDTKNHEVTDVRINRFSTGNAVIYANGRMQYKVILRVQIKDRQGKGVILSDHGTALNSTGQTVDLVTLYNGEQDVDTGKNISIDGVGDFISRKWKALRYETGYDKYLATYGSYSEQIDGSIIEHDTSDDAVYSANDGWNTYTYWVSSTEQTGPEPMHICARVGSHGAYTDSCANGSDESAKVKTLAPKKYTSQDYTLSTHEYPGEKNKPYQTLYSIGLKGAVVHSTERVKEPVAGKSHHRCVAMHHKSLINSSVAGRFNNTSLFLVPDGEEKFILVTENYGSTASPPSAGLNTEQIYYIMDPHNINFIQRYGGDDSRIWTACYPLSARDTPELDAGARNVKFIDSFGNEGFVNFYRNGGAFKFSY